MKNNELSKILSHALRHEPWLYELELDDAGWVPVKALLTALAAANPKWSSVTVNDIADMIERSDKKRHELSGEGVRALYGHSAPQKLKKLPVEPPVVLYHGTSPATAESILINGLRPMNRQYVHMSIDMATAEQVGLRKSKMPIILTIDSKKAFCESVNFYRGNDIVWLADLIPPQFIT
jgi:putative RNA 2'-phosphotransferase